MQTDWRRSFICSKPFLPEEEGDTLSPAEAKAIAEADEWLKLNDPIPHEEVLAEFGLSMADWEKMSSEPSNGLLCRF